MYKLNMVHFSNIADAHENKKYLQLIPYYLEWIFDDNYNYGLNFCEKKIAFIVTDEVREYGLCEYPGCLSCFQDDRNFYINCLNHGICQECTYSSKNEMDNIDINGEYDF